ncbi:MAG: mechanosensitive ion channel [Fibrobacteria bacterium]|nr:mechanosensitive ion channel [Fibrobacteria bacterium]
MKEFVFDIGKIQIEFITIIQQYLPRIIAAAILLLLGWLVSRLVQVLTVRLVTRVNSWGKLNAGLKDSGVQDFTPRAIGVIVFWFSLLLFFASAGQVLGLPIVTNSLSRLASYLPNLLAAFLVLIAGIVLGNFARTALNSATLSTKIVHGRLLGETARIAILGIALMIVLRQTGIDSSVLLTVFGLCLGGLIAGISLAFGFGSRGAVSNMIASRNIKGRLQPGEEIEVNDIQGRITKITSSHIIIQTEKGRALVPAKLFDEIVTFLPDEKS